MKYVISIIFLLCAFQIKAQHDMKDMPGMKMPATKKENKKTEKVIYTCVMHPQVQKDKPGNCPICGMKLVKKTIKIPVAKPDVQKTETKNMPPDTTSSKNKKDMDKNMDMKNNDMNMNMPMND